MPFPWNEHSIPSKFVTPRHIVAASDLTDTGNLLPHVRAQAKAYRAGVTLVHAVRDSAIVLAETILEEEVYARKQFGAMRRTLESDGVRCSCVAQHGNPSAIVQQQIDANDAGRLLIGTHLHGSCGPQMIGSVANALLLESRVPVFVVPAHASAPQHTSPRQILHPVFPAGAYRESVCFAAEVASAFKADLRLLHVIPPSSSKGRYAGDLEQRTAHQVQDFLWPPDLRVRTNVEYGDPVETIVKVARSASVDWIVMGISHDFPWWSRENSHTYQVIADSGCPVLTFHDRIFRATRAPHASRKVVCTA